MVTSYQDYQTGEHKILKIGHIAYLPELNVRKKYDPKTKTFSREPAVFDANDSDTKDLIKSLRDRGYDPQWPVIIGPISEEQVESEVKKRNDLWAGYKLAAKTNPSDQTIAELAAFEFHYTEVKVHKKVEERILLKPEFLGASGNRRNFCILKASVARLVDTKTGVKETNLRTQEVTREIVANPNVFLDPASCLHGLELHCIVEQFPDMEARFWRQMQENEMRKEGLKQLSPIELVLNYYDMIVTGRLSQAKIRKAEKDGTGQKIYGFCILASRFPKLDLVGRLLLPTDNPRHINWSKLPQGEKDGFPTVLRDSNSFSREQYEKKLQAEGNADKVTGFLMGERDVDAKIIDWMTGNKNADKTMAKPKMQQLQEGHPCVVVKNIMADVLQNVNKEVDVLAGKAPAFNSLRGLVDSPCFSSLTELLGLIESAPIETHADIVSVLVETVKHYLTEATTVEA